MLGKSFLLISIRGISLITKFLFVFFLGKYAIDTSVIGEYGIIVSSLGIVVFLLGFEFHVRNGREIAKSNKDAATYIKRQLILYKYSYLFVLPLMTLCFYLTDFIPPKYIPYLILLIIIEHWALENHRILNALKKPVVASLIFGVKNIAWVFISFLDFFFVDNRIVLKRYILYWIVISTICSFVGFYRIKLIVGKSVIKYKIGKFKIVKDIKFASMFMLSSMSFLIINFSDRFMLDYYSDKIAVGVYTTYYQFTNVIEQIIATVLVVMFVPKLVELYNVKSDTFKKEYSKFNHLVLLSSLVFPLLIVGVAPFLFKLMEKDNLLDDIISLYLLLLGGSFYGLSISFHYKLYILEKDKINIWISVLCMCFNLVLNFIFIPKMGIMGASLSTLFTFVLLFSLKVILSIKYKFVYS
ncbi:polysaccharide biosynthesis C-terminal domain-containing protein [Maribacter polysaccharolyticus]|uniref:polysaccharide biosynthesis C-terminal domain-containing protein n=1 Tax=Maribacter polysaccharolyticus TaxID=3020831 RepID=UPI00237F27CE|nr:polysaccharide biosynthesis C-terminal domain-containing protein [Maribacter polysaccharolyticus]MDE3742221.1 polysaccharide biosynthesis C-terminal domain-containing protein [Maribacter polysaccharolyticus]